MKNRLLLVAILIVTILCAGFVFQNSTKPSQYEYKFEYAASEKKANELAAQGWELVAIESPGANHPVATYVFKRAK